MLSDETIVNLLIKGIIDREQIARELDVSHYFQRAEDEPAWRTLWHLHGRTEDQFNVALIEVERAFAGREFIKTGEILHVFGMLGWRGSAFSPRRAMRLSKSVKLTSMISMRHRSSN